MCAHNWIISSTATKREEALEDFHWNCLLLSPSGALECFFSSIYSFSMGHKKQQQQRIHKSFSASFFPRFHSVLNEKKIFFCWLGNQTNVGDQERKKFCVLLFYFWIGAKIYRAHTFAFIITKFLVVAFFSLFLSFSPSTRTRKTLKTSSRLRWSSERRKECEKQVAVFSNLVRGVMWRMLYEFLW